MRRLLAIILAGLALVASMDAASARIRHRHHRGAHAVLHRVVVAPPEQASLDRAAGEFGGYFETGILSPSTADPYGRPGYGYYSRGYKGPGYGYPGY